jgi:arylsulfatase A-like enzyme
LLPVIQSAQAKSPHEMFHWQMGNQWAVREGDWKLIGNPRDTSNKAPLTKADNLFLANLKEDIGEMTNLAADNQDIVARLKAAHEAWANDLEP